MLNLLLPILLPLLLPLFSRNFWPLSVISMFLISTFSFLPLFQPLLSPMIMNNMLSTDLLSSSLVSLTLWISTLMILASTSIFNSNNKTKYFITMTISLSSILILSFFISNFINFYIMFESSLIPTLLLILSWGYQPERLQAGLYLMMYTISASLPLLLMLMMILNSSGHLSMLIPFMTSSLSCNPLNLTWWTLCILAFLVKAPIYLFHLWLPKAHVEAPIAGSMILAGLLLKLGSYGLLRMISFHPNLMFKLSPLCNSLALWGGVMTSMICLRQTDIKSLIAYSSVGHMALIIMGSSLLSPWGWFGALAMMIAHGLCSSCLFCLANLTYESTHTRSMFLTKGLLALFPAISTWWFILSVINMAAPPSINLFAEISLFMSALWASPFYMIPLMLSSFISAAYSLYLYSSTNHGTPTLFLNPLSILSPHTFSIIMFHAIPSITLILKPEIISAWV